MPYKLISLGGGRYKVKSPSGTRAKSTTKSKAKAQIRLLKGIEHGWKPSKKK